MKLYFISGKHFECKKMGAGHVRGETLLFVCAVLANTAITQLLLHCMWW
jgi:hypothetical protein